MPWINTNGYSSNYASILLSAPGSSGVYGIFNSHRWIYIGESDDIRRRLLEHLNGDNPCITRLNPTGFFFEVVPSHQRVGRQDSLILECGPACNLRLG